MPSPRRLVQVFIADTNENVPLADTLLYKGEQKLTDLTDQELFFELDIRTLLAEHNAKRTKLINKSVKDRTEYLEPARIRDLKMTVVTFKAKTRWWVSARRHALIGERFVWPSS